MMQRMPLLILCGRDPTYESYVGSEFHTIHRDLTRINRTTGDLLHCYYDGWWCRR
eukprot:COSAG05_NODE_933_length_6538_cov_16.519646_4_plen_55_part_00